MPMGFATLVGGMTTTIGTSTNLLVVNVAADLGLERFGLFDFAIPASVGACVGLAYLWLVAPRLLRPRVINPSVFAPEVVTKSPPITVSASPTATRIAEISSGLFATRQ